MTGQAQVRELFARRPGTTEGGLLFRVGYADETLPTSGITSLVVALALRAAERPGLDVGASVGPVVTEVRVTGTPDRVRTTLRDVALALSDLPVRHRATETRALAERAGEVVPLPLWRFGHQGYGLGPGRYLGLHRVTDGDLRAWARERFTAADAVVWSRGEEALGPEVPLPGAPAGSAARSAPAVPEAAWSLPAEAHAGGTSVIWDAVVPAVPAAPVLAEVARRALFQSLRHDRGWTYDVAASAGLLDGRHAAFRLSAGLRQETADQATGEFLDTWGRLRHAVPDEELAVARAHLLLTFDEPRQEAVWVREDALLTVLGRPVPTPAERRAALEAVTADDVVGLARQAWDTGLLVTPVREGWAGTSVVPRGAGEPVEGRSFARLDADAAVVIGQDGATLRVGAARTTVRFADAAAVVAYPDGGRLLVGLDGTEIPFEPTLHDDLTVSDVATLVDDRVSSELVIPVPRERAPERPDRAAIEQRRRSRAARRAAENGRSRLSRVEVVRLIAALALIPGLLVAVGGVAVCAGGLVLTLVAWIDVGPQPWGLPVLLAAVGGASGVLTWLCWRGLDRLRVGIRF